jgi:membrane protein DedA with SNARE-associated domain
MLDLIAEWLVNFVHTLGYAGIFIMTFLESTFVPIPSEVTMVPAGYLVQKGEMHFLLVLLFSVLGTLAGSWFNYWIAKHYGRRFLLAYGKYLLFPPEKLTRMEDYFRSHGEISIFTGRLIPGLRHFISFPAGLSHMNLKKFCFYTGLGGGLWMLVLITIGYLIGDNKEMIHHYVPLITYAALALVGIAVFLYIRNHRKKHPAP